MQSVTADSVHSLDLLPSLLLFKHFTLEISFITLFQKSQYSLCWDSFSDLSLSYSVMLVWVYAADVLRLWVTVSPILSHMLCSCFLASAARSRPYNVQDFPNDYVACGGWYLKKKCNEIFLVHLGPVMQIKLKTFGITSHLPSRHGRMTFLPHWTA